MSGIVDGVRHHLGTIEECVESPRFFPVRLTPSRLGQSNAQLVALGGSDGTGGASLKSDLTGPQSEHDEDDEEEFVYPSPPAFEAGEVETREETPQTLQDVQQGVRESVQENIPRPPQPPSPAQLESLHAASTCGDLPLLKQIFQNALRNGEVEPFSLANSASSRTGFTALHAAASRGYLEIVAWRQSNHSFVGCYPDVILVIEDCGAMPDLEDREGEVCFLILLRSFPLIIYRLHSTKLL